ncbi:MAG: hypothetical protein ACR2ME_09650 [Acidimicrobiia bacterium]
MYWLSKPPYLRRAAAVLILLAAMAWEIRPVSQERRPFLAAAVSAGDGVTTDQIDWRDVPVGVLPELAEPGGTFVADFSAGTPLVASMLAAEPAMPDGWWGIEVPVPAGTSAGTDVRLVVDVRQEPRVIAGLVIRIVGEDSFDGLTALVAVPESEVGAAAAALADGSLRTLVGGR